MAAELIALDQWLDSDTRPLYGVVSTGDIWQFGRLNRQQHQIEQDLSLYRVPTDLEDLFPILIAILTGIG
ncbi:hypothetical protein [Sodalinema gerasimenkoae]|uniref:hypothetical protein n=1 Tax=Sodalinema gerasimenkoae TaxID=2862348 RepID=UPI001358A2DE|nr:hypothetical protein [Sodalinema gerasimenkoae]